jgi:hypothetical protein
MSKKIIQVVLLSLIVVVVVGLPTYFVAGKFLMAESFSDGIVKTQRSGKVYFVVPEKSLEGAILVDSKGTRHYILTEEKLRLLGPKMLGGGD